MKTVRNYLNDYDEITIVDIAWRLEFSSKIYKIRSGQQRKFLKEFLEMEVIKAVDIGNMVYLYV